MKTLFPFALLVLLVAIAVGCQQAADQAHEKQYDVTGKVTAVDANKQTVTLDHQDIPGLMAAMEMEFKLDNPGVVDGISAGDHVHGKLQTKSGEYTITHLEKAVSSAKE